MSQTPLTISVDVAEILKEMNEKLDRIQQDVSEMKTDVKVLNEKVDGQGKVVH